MREPSENKPKKHICLGVLAHVDAGKTTLAEGILYLTGSIRTLGRVDHQDAYLDNDVQERARGITIFSKQAELALGDTQVTLIDTPGHVDFSAEMERTLQILDYAVLVISGADGVQSHVETLWRLLKKYEIPVFLFVNKMDQPGTDRARLLAELQRKLDPQCVDFSSDGQDWQRMEPEQEAARLAELLLEGGAGKLLVKDELMETLALQDEELLEKYLETGELDLADVQTLIRTRRVFPCFFGSALRLSGVAELLGGLHRLCEEPMYRDMFAARIYKISRDAQGNRLTHMKITGGRLRVKDVLTNRREAGGKEVQNSSQGRAGGKDTRNSEKFAGDKKNMSAGKDMQSPGGRELSEEEIWEEKVNQIRIYSGASYQAVNEISAGMVCAVTGLTRTRCGEGLGAEYGTSVPVLEPVLSYQIVLPDECDVHQTYRKLLQLEEEEPELRIVWNEQNNEIFAQLMGEVQTEVLKNIIFERFGIRVSFGAGSIVYKETIAEPVIGRGHFEPLRHYAEVHLLMEPGEPGSGLQFAVSCSTDELDLNWQRLILTHLEEKQHPGVLTGSEITDMKITLIAGRAHLKHTEGGDFRQATYRAVRQGLKSAACVLLEPVYDFRMELPPESAGRAMTDIQKMHGSFAPMEYEGEMAVLTGSAPVVTMRGYQTELISYTKGRGRMSCTLRGYEPCHNTEEVIAARGYDSESDLENPTGSVFCAHGAGFVVSWDLVPEYVHLDTEKWLERAGGYGVPADGEWQDDQGRRQGGPGERGSQGDNRQDLNGQAGWADGTEQQIQQRGQSSGANYMRNTAGQNGRASYAENTVGQGGGIKNATGSGRTYRTEIPAGPTSKYDRSNLSISNEELDAIFERTYGPVKREKSAYKKSRRIDYSAPSSHASSAKRPPQEEYLLVDGYNIIFAWEELSELAKVDVGGARTRLMDILSNYQGYKKVNLILVFDAYRVEGGQGSVFKYHNIYVVYTKEAETADQYIEKTVHAIGRNYHVTVATSDALEQVIIIGQGGHRMSARDLADEIAGMEQEIRQNYLGPSPEGRNYLFGQTGGETRQLLEDVRLGKKKL